MTPLSEVAKDVAEALGLGKWRMDRDGSSLTDPYWRCACEDWLHQHKLHIHLSHVRDLEHAAYGDREQDADHVHVEVRCPLTEAPARLVSAVWRRMSADRRQQDFENVPTSVDYDNDCAPD